MYAVIMAGGAGRRFWPLSRSKRPKQFLNILGEDTLLNQTAERLLPLIDRQKTIVLTGMALTAPLVFTSPRDRIPAVYFHVPGTTAKS